MVFLSTKIQLTVMDLSLQLLMHEAVLFLFQHLELNHSTLHGTAAFMQLFRHITLTATQLLQWLAMVLLLQQCQMLQLI